MKPTWIVGIIIIVIVGILIIGSAFGMISVPGLTSVFDNNNSDNPMVPDENIDAEDLGFSNREIHQVICNLLNKSLPYLEHEAYIESLHMTMYGVDGKTAHDVLLDYRSRNSADGFTVFHSGTQSGPGFFLYNEAWNKDADGRSLLVSDGASVQSIYGYETVVLTGFGPLTTYYDYYIFVNTH